MSAPYRRPYYPSKEQLPAFKEAVWDLIHETVISNYDKKNSNHFFSQLIHEIFQIGFYVPPKYVAQCMVNRWQVFKEHDDIENWPQLRDMMREDAYKQKTKLDLRFIEALHTNV